MNNIKSLEKKNEYKVKEVFKENGRDIKEFLKEAFKEYCISNLQNK